MAGTPSTARWALSAATLGLLLAVVVAVIYGYAYRPITVPNVVGMDVQAAEQAFNVVGIEVDLDAEAGTVVEQAPIAGERWRRGDDLVITYEDSSGMHVAGESAGE